MPKASKVFKVPTSAALGLVLWRSLSWVIVRVARSVAFGFAWLLTSTAGRVVLLGGVVLALVDAAWGSDPVALSLIGTLQTVLAVGVIGAVAWWRRMAWEGEVERAIYHAVPGHGARQEPEVRYSLSGGGVHTNRWLGRPDFAFYVPARLRQNEIRDVEEHLREQLPAAKGSSWSFDWNLRSSTCAVRISHDLPHYLDRDGLAERMASAGEAPDRDLIPIGVSVGGVEYIDVEATPHVLGTGETGKGKSVALLGVVCHCLQHADGWTVVACDPKRVELGYLRGRPGVKTVARELDEIVSAIREAEELMDSRFEEMEAAGANHVRKLDPRAKRLLLVVDELQQVTMPSGTREAKETDELKLRGRASLERIAALGRAAGVHLYLSTQRPDVATGTLTGPLKHNLGGRLAVGSMDNVASMMALDTDAATRLPEKPKGRAVWRGIEGEKQIQVVYTEEGDLPGDLPGRGTA